MPRRVAVAALGILLAGCASAKPTACVTSAVRSAGVAVVHGEPLQRAVMALQFLTSKVG